MIDCNIWNSCIFCIVKATVTEWIIDWKSQLRHDDKAHSVIQISKFYLSFVLMNMSEIIVFYSMSHHKFIHCNSASGFIHNKNPNFDVIILKPFQITTWKVSIFGVILFQMREMLTGLTPNTDMFYPVDIIAKVNRLAILQNFSKWMPPYIMEIPRVIPEINK